MTVEEAGKKGGQSRSAAKVAAVRANIAKAHELMRIRRAQKAEASNGEK